MDDKFLQTDLMVVLSDKVISALLSVEETIHLVEAAFAANAFGSAVALPVVVESLPVFNAQFGVKSGYIKSSHWSDSESALLRYLSQAVGDVVGLKAGGYWRNNTGLGLPGHRAAMLLLNPSNGNVTAMLSANMITRLRTAAGGAVSAKYLAREDSHLAAVIGAGEQAHAQLTALKAVRKIRQAYVWARRRAASEAFAAAWSDSGIEVRAVDTVHDATKEADVIITATNSTQALVSSEIVRDGTHVVAVGSDAKGKQELDIGLLQRARVVVDKTKQSIEIGELQQATSRGMSASNMVYAELGEICAGLKSGRANRQEVTVFDSSGVSFQDLVVAGYLARQARARQVGEYIAV